MNTLKNDILWILTPTFALTFLAIIFGWDEKLATSVYNPSSEFAYFVRQHSNTAGALITLFFLAFVLLPIRKKFPLTRQTAYTWLFALIIGGGVFVHVVLKDLTDRPRPRETVLLGGRIESAELFSTQRAELKGKSFPSGHVAMAAAFIIPVFTLRRRNKKAAIALGAFAVAYAAGVSFSRMTLGAHFFTDCLWGFSTIALFAAIGSHLFKENTDVKSRYILAVLAFALFCLVWFNKFKLTLNYSTENAEDIQEISLHCPVDNITVTPGASSTLSVTYRGYGAPLSWLVLKNVDGEVSLENRFGLYHSLTCQIDKLELPSNHPMLSKLN